MPQLETSVLIAHRYFDQYMDDDPYHFHASVTELRLCQEGDDAAAAAEAAAEARGDRGPMPYSPLGDPGLEYDRMVDALGYGSPFGNPW